MSVSYSVCTKVLKKRYWRDIEKVVYKKGGGNNISRGMSRPHPYANKYSTVHKCITIHGISQGEKYTNDYD